ncbi:uromodulin-like 1 [Stigmatopora nigra]
MQNRQYETSHRSKQVVAAPVYHQNNCPFELRQGNTLASSGYHLCIYNETRNLSSLVLRRVPYTVNKSCGGWLFWKACPVTLFRMAHHTEHKILEEQVIRCCHGYVQIGSYCALSLNSSEEFMSKPGSCPTTNGSYSYDGNCDWDIDCPVREKCCNRLEHRFCTNPETSNNYCQNWRSRFNATVTVKTDYEQLMNNGSLVNHSRLLQAMVTGALQSVQFSVYYLTSWPVHPYRTATSLLIDFNLTLSLDAVTSKLHFLLKNIPEVSDMTVKDINECGHPTLHQCSPDAQCSNIVGSYQCECNVGYIDVDPSNPGTHCAASPGINRLQSANITGTSFCIYWSSIIPANQSYLVVLSEGSEVIRGWTTEQNMLEVRDLQPGVLYNVTVKLHTNQSHGDSLHIAVKTDGHTLDATTRLTNIPFTDDLYNMSSQAYKNLTVSILDEIYRSLPQETKTLVNSGQVRIEIRQLSPGSVVVNFTVVFSPGQEQDIKNTSTALLYSLMNSSIYVMDENNTSISDFDECVPLENDCSQWAECTNTWGSYTCSCLDGFLETDPLRPGRVCQAQNDASSRMYSIAGDISVDCRVTGITVTVVREFLVNHNIQETTLYLGYDECGVSRSNGSHAQLIVEWNECGIIVAQNESYYTASVTLYSNTETYLSSDGIWETPKLRLEVPIICTYLRSMLMSADFGPMGYELMQDVITSSGTFQVTVQLLNGTFPLPYNYSLSPEEDVVVEVSMNTSAEDIKVVIYSCWATPTQNPFDNKRFIFLDNRCALNMYTVVLMNGNSSTSRVSVRIFSFVKVNLIYLHCHVQICMQIASDTCVPDCVQRLARSSNIIGRLFGSTGPLLMSDEEAPQSEDDKVQMIGLCILGVIIVLFFVIGSACLFYYQRNRVGHYNFNSKSQSLNITDINLHA